LFYKGTTESDREKSELGKQRRKRRRRKKRKRKKNHLTTADPHYSQNLQICLLAKVHSILWAFVVICGHGMKIFTHLMCTFLFETEQGYSLPS
jgi:transcription elongation factor Elf1